VLTLLPLDEDRSVVLDPNRRRTGAVQGFAGAWFWERSDDPHWRGPAPSLEEAVAALQRELGRPIARPRHPLVARLARRLAPRTRTLRPSRA
jgi:hypothetical protein